MYLTPVHIYIQYELQYLYLGKVFKDVHFYRLNMMWGSDKNSSATEEETENASFSLAK